jgi:uncharacterized protein YndB with AHSA1/START domain
VPDSAPTAETTAETTADRELVLTRLIDARREKVYRCWTEPALLVQWFTIQSWKATRAVLDVRAGGTSCITMQMPDGTQMVNRDVYLEVVPHERLVLTDAFTSAWEPSERAFMVWIVTFADEGGQTRYKMTARHWSVADKEAHEAMGFQQGWGPATDQLTALAQTI